MLWWVVKVCCSWNQIISCLKDKMQLRCITIELPILCHLVAILKKEANLRSDMAINEVPANCIMGIRHSELSKGSRYDELFLGFVVSCQCATVYAPDRRLPTASTDKQARNKKWIYLMLRNSTVWKKWAGSLLNENPQREQGRGQSNDSRTKDI